MATEPTILYDQSFTTGSTSGGERIKIDYRTQLVRQREAAAPFLAFMLNVNSEATLTSTFRAFETRPNPKRAALNGAVAVAGAAAGTVSWVMATGKGSFFNVGDILIPASSQPLAADESNMGLVTAISTDTLTVRANDPLKKICAVADTEIVRIWGNSFQQGALSAKPALSKPLLKSFYTQIFKNSYQVNRTQANNQLYGAPERDRARAEKEIEHLTEINKALYQGDGILDTTGTEPRTTLTGLLNQISSNVLYYGANLSDSALFNFMAQVHAPRYATDGKMSRRLVLCSSDVMNDMQKIALKFHQTMGVVTVFGIDVTKFVWAGRTWDLVEDPTLSEFLPGEAIVIQPRYVKVREYRSTRLEANIQPNDADYFKDQFLTELGLEVLLEELHARIRPGVAP